MKRFNQDSCEILSCSQLFLVYNNGDYKSDVIHSFRPFDVGECLLKTVKRFLNGAKQRNLFGLPKIEYKRNYLFLNHNEIELSILDGVRIFFYIKQNGRELR